MSEIYKNTSHRITLEIDGAVADDTPTATLVRGSDATSLTVITPAEQVGDLQKWTALVGLQHTSVEGPFSVEWDFSINGTAVTKTDWFEVVKPYVTLGQAKSELNLENVSDKDIISAERKARRVIDRFCGQSFGLSRETRLIRGAGDANIKLPRRLHKIHSINQYGMNTPLEGYSLRQDGKILRKEWAGEYASSITVTAPIFNPYYDVKSDTWIGARGATFGRNVEWVVDGDWGYDPVPSVVQDATLILMEQYLCNEAVYRERYIKSMASADFRYEMMPDAFEGTGNLIVDQILIDYVWDSTWLL